MHAKLSPPNASHLLARERLHRVLDAALGRVVFLIAPAGAGKTSLLATWTHTTERPFIWYRVDAGDRDPATTFEWFSLSLPSDRRSGLPALQRPHLLNLEHFSREYFRRWYRLADSATALVIENVHDAATEGGGLATLLPALIEQKPARFTLLLSSRQEPAAVATPLPPTASAPSLREPPVEIRYGDLQYDKEEATALASHLNLALSPSALDAVTQRAGGWMAGLAMLLRHDPANASPRRLVATESDVFEAFAGAAFDALPEAMRQLLLAHAFCPAIRADDCQDAAGTGGRPGMLETLWQSQFFLERRESTRNGTEYICHSLLRSFLQERARSLWTPAELIRLWRTQAIRHAASGDWETAFRLQLLAGDVDAAAERLLGKAADLHAGGRFTMLSELIAQVNQANGGGGNADAASTVASARVASLAYWEGLCCLQAAPVRALDCLRRAHAGHRAAGESMAALLDACAIIDAYFIQWEGWDEAIAWIDEAQRLLDRLGGELPDLLTEVRVIACAQGLIFMQPDHPLIERLFERAVRLMAQCEAPAHRIALAPLLISYTRWHGDIEAMRSYSRQALEAVDAAPDLPQSLLALVWIGVAASADGHACEPARRGMFERMLAQSERLGLHHLDFHAWVNRAQEAMYFDDAEAAEQAFAEALRLYPGTRGTTGLFLIVSLCRLQIRGDWEALVHLAEKGRREDPDLGGWVVGSNMVQLLEAQAQAMLGRRQAAEATLAPILGFARRWDAAGLVMHVALVHAYLALVDGQLDRADDRLREALGIARGRGYRHVHYWWSADFHRPLLVRALEAGIEVDWVRRFIVDQRIAAPAAGLRGWPYQVRIDVLGQFRIDIDGKPLPPGERSRQRALVLIQALAAQGGKALATDGLAADLWPDSDGDAAMASLDITVLRARRLLGDRSTLLVHDGRIGFNPAVVDLDLWAWQALLSRIDAALLEPVLDLKQLTGLLERLKPAQSLVLLEGKADEPWLSRERRRWALRFRHRAQRLIRLIASAQQRADSPASGSAGPGKSSVPRQTRS